MQAVGLPRTCGGVFAGQYLGRHHAHIPSRSPVRAASAANHSLPEWPISSAATLQICSETSRCATGRARRSSPSIQKAARFLLYGSGPGSWKLRPAVPRFIGSGTFLAMRGATAISDICLPTGLPEETSNNLMVTAAELFHRDQTGSASTRGSGCSSCQPFPL